ncbi:MAG: hypothetical protein KF774_21620 [Planctomyces sp.]|nr:hypothetical protein [Planctomyces sp.]
MNETVQTVNVEHSVKGYGDIDRGVLAALSRDERMGYVSVTLPSSHRQIVCGQELRSRLQEFVVSRDGAIFEWEKPGYPYIATLQRPNPRLIYVMALIEEWGVGIDWMSDANAEARQARKPPPPETPRRESDPELRERLLARLRPAFESPTVVDPLPVVSLEDFFEGNADEDSIGCNLLAHPGLGEFRRVLEKVRGRADVQDVLVEISDLDVPPGGWPCSERVYVLTSARPSSVKRWLGRLFPDEVTQGWSGAAPPGAPPLLPGYSVVAAWWD